MCVIEVLLLFCDVPQRSIPGSLLLSMLFNNRLPYVDNKMAFIKMKNLQDYYPTRKSL